VKQLDILTAVGRQGKVIGHDGCSLPSLEELGEFQAIGPDECACRGTGRIPIYFGSSLMEVVDCPNGCGT
jgi:hypothetical protein